jgi:glutathione S-transferase
MPIELYYAPYSSATRVHWAIVELEVAATLHKVDFAGTTLKESSYLALNPNGKVPLLVVDGKPLWESIAILGYLGDRYGIKKRMWPAPHDVNRFDALAWLAWSSTELGAAVGRLHLAVDERSAVEHHAAPLVAEARRAVATQLAILDGRLAGRTYIVGDEFTLVDIANASVVWWLTFMKFDLAPYGRVKAWVERCTKRPALASILAA